MNGIFERIRSHRHGAEIVGLLAIAFGIVSLLSLSSYSASDPSWFTHGVEGPVRNHLGPVGTLIAEALLQLLGVTR